MPHIILEYSANLIEKNSIKDLFPAIHHMLAEQLPTELLSCRSRVIEQASYYLGDGTSPGGFVHLELKTLKGRTKETLNKIGDNLLTLLQHHFSQSAQSLKLDITLEIVELSDNYYSPWITRAR